jgi:hypothetical protein
MAKITALVKFEIRFYFFEKPINSLFIYCYAHMNDVSYLQQYNSSRQGDKRYDGNGKSWQSVKQYPNLALSDAGRRAGRT